MREQLINAEKIRPIKWDAGSLLLLDQRYLPQQQLWLECTDCAEVTAAIVGMAVRGAPAIGIAAAFAVVLSVREHWQPGDGWQCLVQQDVERLAAARPTAGNLSWAIALMQQVLATVAPGQSPLPALAQAAMEILHSDREANLVMAMSGLEIISRYCEAPQQLLTHCNAGALATGGFGTALGVIRAAHLSGLVSHVHVDETRPWLQGSRLTAWELASDGIPLSVNADAASAQLMRQGDITWVIVGADRISANGDVANKIGTYQLAVLARYHDVRMMVVAPTSTIDMQLASGADIEIEQRSADELLQLGGQRIAAQVAVLNPVFDVTPAQLVDVIVTERGVVENPDAQKMQRLMSKAALH